MEKKLSKAQAKLKRLAMELCGKIFRLAGMNIVVEGLHLFEVMVRDEVYYKIIVRFKPAGSDEKTPVRYEQLDVFLVQAY